MAAQHIFCCIKSDNYSTDRLFDSILNDEDVTTIQTLLQEGADIDARDSKGYTPLLLACLYRREEIVDLLIKSGANVDFKCNSDEYTVLHYASEYGWTNIVHSLVEKVTDLNARDVRGETPMHHASRSGCLEVVKCLVEEGADIDPKNILDFTPLICAIQVPWINVVDLLLKSGASVDGNEFSLLYYAVENGWTKLGNAVVKRIPDINKCLNVSGETALHIASKRGHLDIVVCLVEEGADVNIMNDAGQTALHTASSLGHLEIVKWLVEKGADVNARELYIVNGDTALHLASKSGHLEIVQCLVEGGADVNMKECQNETPLLLAAKCSHKDVVDLLMRYGANVNATNAINCTLLHHASQDGWIDIVQCIVNQNCDLDARDVYGVTALGDACISQHLDIAKHLLQAGASWNVVDEKGNSPLNYITREEEPEFEFIKLLIENGAYLKRFDYESIVNSSLEVLQDVKLCSQAIVNKFNNHDLPELYMLPASASLPRIEKMEIVSGSEVALAIERTVRFEIQTKGYCNILQVQPIALSLFSIRSVLDYCEKKKSELRNSFKRPVAFDPSDESQFKKQCMYISSDKI